MLMIQWHTSAMQLACPMPHARTVQKANHESEDVRGNRSVQDELD